MSASPTALPSRSQTMSCHRRVKKAPASATPAEVAEEEEAAEGVAGAILLFPAKVIVLEVLFRKEAAQAKATMSADQITRSWVHGLFHKHRHQPAKYPHRQTNQRKLALRRSLALHFQRVSIKPSAGAVWYKT